MRTCESVRLASLAREYPDLLSYVLTRGQRIESRAGPVTEVTAFHLELENPGLCVVSRDGFSREFMHAEIGLLLAGDYSDRLLRSITPQAADLISDTTAYGPRTAEQLLFVQSELIKTPDSRRAVVYVGRETDLPGTFDSVKTKLDKGEMPCTMTWQFFLRNGQLHMIVCMRSWDLVWGLSYDVPCFVAVQVMVAKALGARVGTYSHFSGSAHVYERHMDLVKSARPNPEGELTFPFRVYGSVAKVQHDARYWVMGQERRLDEAGDG